LEQAEGSVAEHVMHPGSQAAKTDALFIVISTYPTGSMSAVQIEEEVQAEQNGRQALHIPLLR
jgi:hypothetical protein